MLQSEQPAPRWHYGGQPISRNTLKAREFAQYLKLQQESYDSLPRRKLFVPVWFMKGGGVWV